METVNTHHTLQVVRHEPSRKENGNSKSDGISEIRSDRSRVGFVVSLVSGYPRWRAGSSALLTLMFCWCLNHSTITTISIAKSDSISLDSSPDFQETDGCGLCVVLVVL